MTDTQLCLAVGVPTIALVLGMIGDGLLFSALSARMSSLELRILALESSLHTVSTLSWGAWRTWTRG